MIRCPNQDWYSLVHPNLGSAYTHKNQVLKTIVPACTNLYQPPHTRACTLNRQLPRVKRKSPRLAVIDGLGPVADSLAAAFKTAFERLSNSNVFGLMPDPSFFTFARLSLPPSVGCLDDDAIRHEAKLL